MIGSLCLSPCPELHFPAIFGVDEEVWWTLGVWYDRLGRGVGGRW